MPLAQHTRPTKESIDAIINKASKFDGRNVLHGKQDAEEVRRRQAAGEDIAEMMLPDDFAGEGNGESEEEEDEMDVIGISESEDDEVLEM